MLSGVFLAGQTLKMLVRMSQAKKVLEIGMFTGYGALSMAEGLPEDGCLVACELEQYLKEFAQPIFDKSPHGKKITVKTGSAMDTLKVRENLSKTIEHLPEQFCPFSEIYYRIYRKLYRIITSTVVETVCYVKCFA